MFLLFMNLWLFNKNFPFYIFIHENIKRIQRNQVFVTETHIQHTHTYERAYFYELLQNVQTNIQFFFPAEIIYLMYVLYIPGNCMLYVVVVVMLSFTIIKVKTHLYYTFFSSSHFYDTKHQNKRKSTTSKANNKRIEKKENERTWRDGKTLHTTTIKKSLDSSTLKIHTNTHTFRLSIDIAYVTHLA